MKRLTLAILGLFFVAACGEASSQLVADGATTTTRASLSAVDAFYSNFGESESFSCTHGNRVIDLGISALAPEMVGFDVPRGASPDFYKDKLAVDITEDGREITRSWGVLHCASNECTIQLPKGEPLRLRRFAKIPDAYADRPSRTPYFDAYVGKENFKCRLEAQD